MTDPGDTATFDALPATDAESVFAGGGEMGALMRQMDWSATPLGPVSAWPQSLKTCVRIMLTSQQQMFVGWGDHLIMLYNDPYISVLGGKHPAALGRPASVVWQEVWSELGIRAESAVRKNEGTFDADLLLVMERNGYPEETYFTFSYSPVPNDTGGAGGFFCACTEDTQRIVGERQLALLRNLAAAATEVSTGQEAGVLNAVCLNTNAHDLPFAMIYEVDLDQRRALLIGTSGILPGHPAAPASATLDAAGIWPFDDVIRAGRARLITDLPASFDGLPSGPWDRPPQQAVVLPIASLGQAGRSSVLIVGLNPYRLFDASYRGFLELVASQIASNIATAQAYEAERQRAEALAEIDRAKTAFFSNVSHEFRTPLTLMLGPLEDLLASPEAAAASQTRETLTLIQRNGLRLLKLVNTLLDFSRIEAGRVQAVYEPVDLAHLTTDLASSFRSATDRAGLRLTVDCPPLPAPVYIDRDMWEKIVLNLVSNAFKFTFDGEIGVGLHDRGPMVELEVRDTGVGIPASELPHIFERFHRVEGARGRTFEGSGIGLALVQEFVRLHGGTVSIASSEGAGTTVTVAIPAGTAHLPAERIHTPHTLQSTALGTTPFVEEALRWLPAAQDGKTVFSATDPADTFAPTAAPEENGPPARILLADDNADMRDYVQRILGARFAVEAVADGVAALEAARRRPPELVLTDVMMPRLDGFGLLRALRHDPATSTVPVILLSARAGEEARVEGVQAGADDYLIKPFSARELLARVEGHLRLARLRRDAELSLRAAQERLQITLAASDTGILRWDPATTEFLEFDENLKRLFGFAPDEEVRGTADVLPRIHPDDLPDVVAGIERSQQGTPFEMEYRVVLPDGGIRWLFTRARFEADAGGDAAVFVGVCTDITRRKQGELERAQLLASEQAARLQAERAVRLRDEFLSIAAHELKTPITSLTTSAQLLQRQIVRTGQTGPGALERLLPIIGEQSAKLDRLVSQLLDISRIESGKLELQFAETDLRLLIEGVARTVQLTTERHAIVLRGAPTVLAQADALRLEQVLTNLLTNAVKFSPEGGDIEVTLAQPDPATAAISVRDYGIGIGPEHQPHVFGRFYQAGGNGGMGGMGLGLYVSAQIVAMHHGQITVESPDDGGTRFVVQLPVRRAVSGPAGSDREEKDV